MPIKIFCCYAHEDKEMLKKLETHLKSLEREGLVDVWNDRDISPGTEWEPEISKHLNEADIILLLISPYFIASEYIYGVEMKRALERHSKGEARVIPIILEYVHWQIEPLRKLQAVPTDAKPVMSTNWYTVNEAFLDVVNGIRIVIAQITSHRASVLPFVSEEMQKEPTQVNVTSPINQQRGKVSHFKSPLVVEKLALIRTLTGHTGKVNSVAISPDGQTLVSGSDDKTIKVWGGK